MAVTNRPTVPACLAKQSCLTLRGMDQWTTAAVGIGSLGPFARNVHVSGFCFTHFPKVQRVACFCPAERLPWHRVAMEALEAGRPWPRSPADPYNVCADASEFMAWLDQIQGSNPSTKKS